MKKIILLFAITKVNLVLYSQPYIDIVKLNYSYSPLKGLNEKKFPLQSNFFTADVTLPIELKKVVTLLSSIRFSRIIQAKFQRQVSMSQARLYSLAF